MQFLAGIFVELVTWRVHIFALKRKEIENRKYRTRINKISEISYLGIFSFRAIPEHFIGYVFEDRI